MIGNTTYLGHVRSGSNIKLDAHPPLVSQRLFDQANAVTLTTTKSRRVGVTAGKTLTQGLATCAVCGHKLQTGLNGKSLRMYCKYVHCPTPNNIQVDVLDTEVETRIFDYIDRHGPSLVKRRDDTDVDLSELHAAEAALKDAEYARNLFLENLDAIAILGQERWNAQALRHTHAVEAALGALAAAEGNVAADETFSRVPLREAWHEYSIQERRSILFKLISRLEIEPVHGKRGVPGSERVHIQLVGALGTWLLPGGNTQQNPPTREPRLQRLGTPETRALGDRAMEAHLLRHHAGIESADLADPAVRAVADALIQPLHLGEPPENP